MTDLDLVPSAVVLAKLSKVGEDREVLPYDRILNVYVLC